MKLAKYLLLFATLVIGKVVLGQIDSTIVDEPDTVYFENRPNYFGVNLTPFFSSILGSENNDVKAFVVYKRNRGDKNLRFSANYSTIANRSRYNYFNVISTTDTSYSARFFTGNYKNYDLRFGFEEIKGYQYSRLHIGADFIAGMGTYTYNYFENDFIKDSTGIYRVSTIDPQDQIKGRIVGDYINLGVSVTFGFDWFVSEDFLFTFQLAPQFTYHMLSSYRNEDTHGVYSRLNSFTDFNMGYFDVMMLYRF
jgi:hypothetical protein